MLSALWTTGPRNITSHSMENLAFHRLLRWNMITLPILTTSLIHFSLKGWENVLFELGRERIILLRNYLLLSLSRILSSAFFASSASCDNQVISLEEKTITASSWLNNDTVANNAGLSLTNSSWCAAEDDAAPYLQVNLGRRKHGICAIATQGDPTADRWVETYQIQTSTNGATWTDYEEGEAVRVGSLDTDNTNTQTNVTLNCCRRKRRTWGRGSGGAEWWTDSQGSLSLIEY